MGTQVFNLREFRNSLGRFATGVTVVTALQNGKVHGMTANAFVSVSLNPPLVLVSLDNRSRMHRILPAVGRFGISVLTEDQKALSDHFAGRPIGEAHFRFIDRAGTALLDGALAHFAVKVLSTQAGGDHTLYIGSVEYFEHSRGQATAVLCGKLWTITSPRIAR